MIQVPRPPASPAALVLALISALFLAGTASADAVGEQAARVVGTEHSALDAVAGERLAELTQAMRPVAREPATARSVVVASRGVGPDTIASLTAALVAPSKPAAPARLDMGAIDAMPAVSGDAQMQCLAQAIYFEARGEPLDGQIAVAEVVLNRVDDPKFPKTICGVTRQGAGSGRGCQFSYVCDRNSDTMKSAVSRERSEKIASLMLAGRARTVTDGATYFHTRSIRPDWSRRFVRTASIGHHLFYRSSRQVAGS